MCHFSCVSSRGEERRGGGEDNDEDDPGEGPSAAGHPTAPTPSTTRQSGAPASGRVLTDAVLQLQRETIQAINNLTDEMRRITNVLTEIATTLKEHVQKMNLELS